MQNVNNPHNQSFSLHSYVRFTFDLPLCSARLFEEGLSIHTYETCLAQTKFNHFAELITSLGPCSRRVCVFQAFLFLLLLRSFFFFARMSCSEQSPFHGQASDRVWSFPNCSFKASRRKKEKKKKKTSFQILLSSGCLFHKTY